MVSKDEQTAELQENKDGRKTQSCLQECCFSQATHMWCCSGVGRAVQGWAELFRGGQCCSGVDRAVQEWAELFTGPQSLQWDLGKAPQAQCIPEHLPDSSEPYSAI